MKSLKKLSKDPIKLADEVVRLMNENREFMKAMQIALFNNQL